MPNPEMRKPVPRNRRPAIRKASKSIVSEFLGTLMAALIFAASMWSSVFGMTGASDHQEAMIVAEASDHE